MAESKDQAHAHAHASAPTTTPPACLYLKRLADIQLPVLEPLLTLSVEETKRRHS